MIPKIIHYSWFSGEPYPDWIKKCIETWKEFLPEYEFVLWDMNKLESEINSTFVTEAIKAKKWAFAADYTRLYAVYKYGGIWLDTDIEFFKPLDDEFLKNTMFIGKESWEDPEGHIYLTSHCFGAEAKHPFIKESLDYYKDRHFIISDGEGGDKIMDMKTISQMQAEKALKYGFDWDGRHRKKSQMLANGVMVYPSYYFCRPEYTSIKKVYCIHRCSGAWRDKDIDGRSMTDPKKLTLKVILSRIKRKLGFK